MDLKDQIFKEFKEQQSQKKDVQEPASDLVVVEEPNKSFKKKKNKKRKKEKKVESSTPALNEFESKEFIEFKKSLLENDIAKDFIQVLLPNYIQSGFTDISINKYVSLKMKHKRLNAFILNPSFEDVSVGKPGEIYFVRPLEMQEYREFLLNVGPKDEHLDEFIDFCLEHCIVYPTLEKKQVEDLSTGKRMSIHGTIMNISDLNKTFNVIEV